MEHNARAVVQCGNRPRFTLPVIWPKRKYKLSRQACRRFAYARSRFPNHMNKHKSSGVSVMESPLEKSVSEILDGSGNLDRLDEFPGFDVAGTYTNATDGTVFVNDANTL